RLQHYGTPQDVYAHPANRVVADFMGLVNLLPATVVGTADALTTIEAPGGLKLQVPLSDGIATGDKVEVSIRPENIRLRAGGDGALATISERTFLGNISEYYVSLDSGPTLRVQTHPGQVLAPGDKVAVEIDA